LAELESAVVDSAARASEAPELAAPVSAAVDLEADWYQLKKLEIPND
jgi:hypothetical protein